MKNIKQKEQEAFEMLKGKFGYTNRLSAPRLVKAVVSVGTGKMSKVDRKVNERVMDRLAKITGQKPAIRVAKKSIASFKLREGEPVGVVVTLRGKKMYDFLDKLVSIALPRTKDFRGLNSSNVDELGNMTMGIREHTIFPEIKDEELKDVFSLAISVVTTIKGREEAMTFFEYLGMPFKKADTK
jgi:large subunit ribosomal protein L5